MCLYFPIFFSFFFILRVLLPACAPSKFFFFFLFSSIMMASNAIVTSCVTTFSPKTFYVSYLFAKRKNFFNSHTRITNERMEIWMCDLMATPTVPSREKSSQKKKKKRRRKLFSSFCCCCCCCTCWSLSIACLVYGRMVGALLHSI